MSVRNQITTYQSTGRGFNVPGNFLQNIAGSFLAKKTWTVTDAQLENSDYFFDSFDNLDIIPLHLVQSLIRNDEETVIQPSLLDFDYELRPGKYKHTLRFDWDLAFHQIVETYSGSDLYIVEYDQTGNLILAETETNGVYRGVKTDSLILQKPKVFGNGTEPAYSDLNVELNPKDTLKIICVDWLPEQIDKLFITLQIESSGTDFINFTAKYNSTELTTINSSDVTVLDNSEGSLSFEFFNYDAGVYRISGIEAPGVRTGCLIVNSTRYLGQIRYRYELIVEVVNNAIWGSGDNEVWADGNNAVFTD